MAALSSAPSTAAAPIVYGKGAIAGGYDRPTAGKTATVYTKEQIEKALRSGVNPSAYETQGTAIQYHGYTSTAKPGQQWDAVLNQWVPQGQLSPTPQGVYLYGQAPVAAAPPVPVVQPTMVAPNPTQNAVMPPVNPVTRVPSPTDTASIYQPQPVSSGQQTGQPPHAAPQTPATGSYQPQQSNVGLTAIAPPALAAPAQPALTATPVSQPTFIGPTGGPQMNPNAQAEQSIVSLFGKVLHPSQVPLRIFNKLLPSQQEMLRGAWEAMGIFVPDIDAMINAAGNTQGIAFQGQYGAIGR